jgi:xylulokinase
MGHFLLGLDIGSSSVKASVVDAETGLTIKTVQSPEEEMHIKAVKPGWAEQNPDMWWEHACNCIRQCVKSGVKGAQIEAIGISYQMHGLVIVGKDHRPLRDAIIWCDSRAVQTGDEAFKNLGADYCLKNLLNSPGNFTASKLKWVKENEPRIFEQIHKAMLPGDFIALQLTGEITTTDTGLSEGIFWDYQAQDISQNLLNDYQLNKGILPTIQPVFSVQGMIRKEVAEQLGINPKAKISYRAGDQPNNAFSLHVLNPGETAATAGTSGVIYSVTDKNAFDPLSRVNTFIHVNNDAQAVRNGVLLCINGTGILNSWLRKNIRSFGSGFEYPQMNDVANDAPIGSGGLLVLPFGNGAERVLENRTINASFHGLDFNRHTQSHIFRAAQEGIVFALRYGFDVLKSMGLESKVIRAGNANMFLSPLFRDAFVNTIGAPLELYNTDGATGAAIGAGIGAKIFPSFKDAFKGLSLIKEEQPSDEKSHRYQAAYEKWKTELERKLN